MKSYKFAKCFIRYEPEIEDGMMFLFNKENGKMLEGNYLSYIVAKALMEGQDRDVLVSTIAKTSEQDINVVQQNVKQLIDFFIQEGFIVNDEFPEL